MIAAADQRYPRASSTIRTQKSASPRRRASLFPRPARSLLLHSSDHGPGERVGVACAAGLKSDQDLVQDDLVEDVDAGGLPKSVCHLYCETTVAVDELGNATAA